MINNRGSWAPQSKCQTMKIMEYIFTWSSVVWAEFYPISRCPFGFVKLDYEHSISTLIDGHDFNFPSSTSDTHQINRGAPTPLSTYTGLDSRGYLNKFAQIDFRNWIETLCLRIVATATLSFPHGFAAGRLTGACNIYVYLDGWTEHADERQDLRKSSGSGSRLNDWIGCPVWNCGHVFHGVRVGEISQR